MFKILSKIFISILFCLCFLIDGGGNLKGESTHTFYFYSKSSNAKIVTLSEEKASNFIYFKNFLKGESVVFYDENKVFDLLFNLSAKKIFEENGDDFNCQYFYSKKINDYIILKGQKVNLHVCYNNDSILFGYPLVFGSY